MAWMPLTKAKICVNCDVVFEKEEQGGCPVCGEQRSWIYLTNWIQTLIKTKREKKNDERQRDEAERTAEDSGQHNQNDV